MEENVKIKESLRIVIRDKKSGEIIRDESYEVKVPFLKRLLYKLLGKKSHATLTSYGKEMVARLYGNVGTAYHINQIGAKRDTTWDYKSSSNSYEATGKLKVSNSSDPWDVAGTYTEIRCRNSSDTGNYHNSISINVTIASGQEWWAEVVFTFS